MSEKMSNAPIFFAAAQLTFNEIRGMEKYVDLIQEQMRTRKFVDFLRDEQKTLQFNAASPELGIQQTSTTRWQFVNFENTSGYVLLPNSLFFQTTAYETSDELRQALVEGIQLVHEIVGLDFVQAIGIRTLDAIVPNGTERIAAYLKPNLLGFSEGQGTLQRSLTETVTRLTAGTLVSRVVILGPETSGLGVPFDLHPIKLTINPRFQGIRGVHAILDNDRIQQERFRFDLEEITSRFISLKKDLKEAFFAAVTNEAKEIWR